MKLVHISDLHIGKHLNRFSLLEDQEFILKRILEMLDNEKPKAVLIAGDIYDKADPSERDVVLFDRFLTNVAKKNIEIFIIAGNHDSADRLSFGSDFMNSAGVHIAPAYGGDVKTFTLTEGNLAVDISLLPFLRRSTVKNALGIEEFKDYTEAIGAAINRIELNKEHTNILVAHQFVTGAVLSEDEERTVGGIDDVAASVFDDFDYVALGHLHRPQYVGSRKIRYSGTPLKYSFSEKNDTKSATILNIKENHQVEIEEYPLKPKRDLRELRGTYEELVDMSFYNNQERDDYLRIVLTNEDEVLDAANRLRVVYKNLMELYYDNKRTNNSSVANNVVYGDKKSPMEYLEEFYRIQNGSDLSDEQKALAAGIFNQLTEGGINETD